jgi:hypothetical protein
MIAIILTLALTMTLPSQSAVEHNSTIIETLQKLHRVTSTSTTQNAQKDVELAIEGVRTPDDLRRIALLSLNMTTGLAEHERVDQVYWTAFWMAARKLASRDDADSMMQFDQLVERAQLGGGELMAMNELREKQKQRRMRTKE